MEIMSTIGLIISIITVSLFIIFKNSAQKYIDEKAKNLATIEDIQKITNEVEKVKSNYQQRSHAWKQLFEYEYAILKEVWTATWEFQEHAKSLLPMIDKLPNDLQKRKNVLNERYKKYSEALDSFKDSVLKNQPFIPVYVYEVCMPLREVVIDLYIEFEMSHDGQHKPDWKKVRDCIKELDGHLDKLNMAIHEHIYGKIK